jgi:hypothetical protein
MTHDYVLAWAAYLLSGWWDRAGAVPPPPRPIGTVPERLRRNGVPLLTLARDARPSAAALLATAHFRDELASDQARLDHQLAAFGEVRGAWQQAGIPALFVKAMGPPPTFPYVSNNLDILVPTAQEDEARWIVRRLGFVELRHIEEPHKFLFRRYHLGESAFDVHIHGRLEWHTEFVDSQAVWGRGGYAADCDLALTPCVEDGLLIALAHAVYENKALKLIELGKLIYAARTLKVDWDLVAAGAAAKGWLDGYWAALFMCNAWEERLYGPGTSSLPRDLLDQAGRNAPVWLRERLRERVAGEQHGPVGLGFVNSKRLFYTKMLADPSMSAAERAKDVVSHTLYGTRVRLRLYSQRPMLVAFDGIDGSDRAPGARTGRGGAAAPRGLDAGWRISLAAPGVGRGQASAPQGAARGRSQRGAGGNRGPYRRWGAGSARASARRPLCPFLGAAYLALADCV